ncbi:unnamed protein product [Anisakis simplex]|uniref:Uncharacterized protein n=2 Tax=Anisakis simplex TaxID=6269 RepID=A0A0M3KIF0_ANISI|nr:unnamed protein product [Anisakis simplex]
MPQKAYSSDGVSRRSAFEILLENKKRRSDHRGAAGDGMQRGFSAVQLHNSDVCSQFSSRLPDRIPASCVLLRQSQEMLSKRKREALSKSQTEDEDDQELSKDETIMKENRVLGSSLTTVQMNRSDIECSTSMSETTRFGTMNESSDASLANAILTSRDIRVKRAINYDELHDANDNEAGTIEVILWFCSIELI